MGMNKGKKGLCLPSRPGSAPSHCRPPRALLWWAEGGREPGGGGQMARQHWHSPVVCGASCQTSPCLLATAPQSHTLLLASEVLQALRDRGRHARGGAGGVSFSQPVPPPPHPPAPASHRKGMQGRHLRSQNSPGHSLSPWQSRSLPLQP